MTREVGWVMRSSEGKILLGTPSGLTKAKGLLLTKQLIACVLEIVLGNEIQ